MFMQQLGTTQTPFREQQEMPAECLWDEQDTLGNATLMDLLVGLGSTEDSSTEVVASEESPWWAEGLSECPSGELAVELGRVHSALMNIHFEQIGALDNEVRHMLEEPPSVTWDQALTSTAASTAVSSALGLVASAVGGPLAGTTAGVLYRTVSRQVIRAAVVAMNGSSDGSLGLAEMFLSVQNAGLNAALHEVSVGLYEHAGQLVDVAGGAEEMRRLATAVEAQFSSARQIQVDQATEGWLTLLAWTSSGTLLEGGTDLTASIGKGGNTGVVSIGLQALPLDGTPAIGEISVPGTGTSIHEHLEGKTLGDMDVPWICENTPYLARSAADWPTDLAGTKGFIRVGVNEEGAVFDTMVDRAGLIYLLARYRPDLALDHKTAESMREVLCGALLTEIATLAVPQGSVHA